MNEKLKFNIERLKRDFEDVIDELCTEFRGLEEELNDSVSQGYVDDLQEELEGKQKEIGKLEDKIADLEDKIEELEEQLKQYKNE